MELELQHLLGVVAGIGLAAACGFRVFVPLLVAAIAVRAGVMHVAEGFAWLGSTPALVALSVATCLEVGAYYVPGLDHLLDGLATPAAAVAGTLVCASFVVDVDPWLRWSLAAVAGGGAATAVQAATVAARAASAVGTLGLANPIVATAELGGAALTALGAVVVPVSIAVFLVGAAVLAVVLLRRRSAAAPGLAAG